MNTLIVIGTLVGIFAAIITIITDGQRLVRIWAARRRKQAQRKSQTQVQSITGADESGPSSN